MSHLSDRLILKCLTSEAGQTKDEQLARLAQAIAQALSGNDDEPGSLFLTTKQVGGQMANCQNCHRPNAHSVPMYVGGQGDVTMQLCGLPDCWEAAEMSEPRGEVAALGK